jgi:rSAM/selenodomain-associated transferase 2
MARSLPPLAEGLEAGLIRELVISDGGSQDATQRIAEAAGAEWIEGPASRGGQLRRGADAAQGEWLLFLHADTALPVGWSTAIDAQIATGRPAAFRLRFDASGLGAGLVAGWANLRSRLFGLPYGDQALLISRGEYDAVGGYHDIPLMEDVAMARALRGRIDLLPLHVKTSAARYQREGWLRRGARNLSLLLRFLAGADPGKLARRY